MMERMKRKWNRVGEDGNSSERLFASTYLRGEVFHYYSLDSLLTSVSVFKLISNPWHSCPTLLLYKSLYKPCILRPRFIVFLNLSTYKFEYSVFGYS